MNNYELLLKTAEENNIEIVEKKFKSNAKGLLKGSKIAINENIPTIMEKTCILSEELGHYYTTVGNILDVHNTDNYKQELKGRIWAYNRQIGLSGLIGAHEHGCKSRYEIAEYLEVTEEFLENAIIYYTSKYGVCQRVNHYLIYFVPHLGIMRLCE